MANILAICQIAGLLFLWAIFSAMLIPCAIVVWLLKFVVRGLEWARDKAVRL